MDGSRFDQLTRLAVSSRSRRSLVGASLGLLAARFTGTSAVDAAAKRANGQICRKAGDCKSNLCGPKDASGRRYCQCATECLMVDGSPGDCSSGFCTCSNCSSESCNTCVQNLDGRFFCGTVFVVEKLEEATLTESSFSALDSNSSLADLEGANDFFSTSGVGCTSNAECEAAVGPIFRELCPALYYGAFCVKPNSTDTTCAVTFNCGPNSACFS